MKVQYQISEEEFIKLKFFLYYRKPWRFVLIVLYVCAIIFAIIRYAQHREQSPFSIPLIIFGFYYLIIFPVYYYYQIQKEYRSSKILQREVISEFLADEITDTSNDSNSSISWSDIYQIEEFRGWFLFYYSKNLFGLLPKKNMDQTQVTYLRELICGQNIPAKLRSD